MAPRHKYKTDQRKYVEAYIRMLANSPTTESVREELKHAPQSVIKVICNIANQILHNPKYKVDKFPPQVRATLLKHKGLIELLCDRHKQPKAKQLRLLQQRGGLSPLIPILLSTAIGTFGPMIFDAIASKFRKD